MNTLRRIVLIPICLLAMSFYSNAQKRDTVFVDQEQLVVDTIYEEAGKTAGRFSLYTSAGMTYNSFQSALNSKSVYVSVVGARTGIGWSLTMTKTIRLLFGVDFEYQWSRLRNRHIYNWDGSTLSNYRAREFSLNEVRLVQMMDNANATHHYLVHIPVSGQYQFTKYLAATVGAEVSFADPFREADMGHPMTADPKRGAIYTSGKVGVVGLFGRISIEASYQSTMSPLFKYNFSSTSSTTTSTYFGNVGQHTASLSIRRRM